MANSRSRTPSGFSSPYGSMMSLSPSVDGDRKKTMQTTVAIVEEDPHRFKIQPLKEVPVERRPFASPSVNFDRPYVGCHLDLPTMYQLAPSRCASTYSFNSANSDYSIGQAPVAELASPNPDCASVYSFDAAPTKEGNSFTGLGFEDLPDGASLAYSSTHPSFSSQVSNDSRSVSSSHSHSLKDRSWVNFSGPDLTFATSDGSSAHSRVYTPAGNSDMPSSNSTESSRKAKSMMILNSLSKESLAHQSTSELELLPSISSSSLRRLRAKTLSVSTSEKGRMYRRKRHAIYGNNAIQLSISPNEHSFSVTPSTPELDMDSGPLEPSPCILAVERKNAAKDELKKTSLTTSKRILNFLDPNLAKPSDSLLSVPASQSMPTHASFVRSVQPLRIVRTRSKQFLSKLVKASPQGPSDFAKVYHHPIIEDLLQELDIAISEWRVVSYL